jgi:hypothetical protein
MAAESSAELCEGIAANAYSAKLCIEQRTFASALTALRGIMRSSSKLYARVTAMAELELEAKSVAEVDRALRRAENGTPRPIPGDTPLSLGEAREGKGRRQGQPTRPRKGGRT